MYLVFHDAEAVEGNNEGFPYFPGGSEVKASACNAGDLGLIPGLGRFPGEENSNPLQYSCLENPMDGGAWWTTVHGVSNSLKQLSDFISARGEEVKWKRNEPFQDIIRCQNQHTWRSEL